MDSGPKAYLVEKLRDGYGTPIRLVAGQTCTLGRASSNRIIIKDDLSSREHAEITYDSESWRIRDLGSLNGTRLKDQQLQATRSYELEPGVEIVVGRTVFVFVEEIKQLPDHPEVEPENIEVKSLITATRFLEPVAGPDADASVAQDYKKPSSQDPDRTRSVLRVLYQLAIHAGEVDSTEDLFALITKVLFQLTGADRVVIALAPGMKSGILFTTSDSKVISLRQVTMKDIRVVSQQIRSDPEEIEGDITRNRPEAMRDKYVSRRVNPKPEKELLRWLERVGTAALEKKVGVQGEEINTRSKLSVHPQMTAITISCAPIKLRSQILGLIFLEENQSNQSAGVADTLDVEIAMAVGELVGLVLQKLQRQDSLTAAVRSLRDLLGVESELIGASESIKEIESQIARVAQTNATCLIRGESGVGKELVARAVHYSSPRREGPFICLNCAALTETLLESELFGHEKGAFTGATERKIGKFEAANLGTIFLDEIGEMQVGTQSKLLRILEGQTFERVGGNSPIKVDVRVVAATNQPLEKAVAAGTFRLDLFYRLQVVQLMVAPLRERKADIPLLAEHFLQRFAREMGRKIRGFTPAALQKLNGYNWPGNVRELRNVVERAVALCQPGTAMLDVGDIWLSSLEIPGLMPPPVNATPSRPSGEFVEQSLEEMEKEHILRTLEHTDWNKSQSASILKIERSTLDRKIRTYALKKS